MNKTQLILILYSAFLVIGGLIGFLRANSLPSLIMSTLFALLILLFMRKEKILYLILAFLSLFFAYRTVSTGKLIPAGFLALITLGVFIFVFFSSRRSV